MQKSITFYAFTLVSSWESWQNCRETPLENGRDSDWYVCIVLSGLPRDGIYSMNLENESSYEK